MPAFGAFRDLKAWLNELRTAAGDRVFFAFGDEEFDLCLANLDVVLSNEFAAYLGLNIGLTQSACYTTSMDLTIKNQTFDYVVKFIAPISKRNHIIGVVDSTKGPPYSSDLLPFYECCATGDLEIYFRNIDGTESLANCGTSMWGAILAFN